MTTPTSELQDFHWLADMVESIEVGLVVVDLAGQVQAWNGFMEHHSGFTASQVHGRSLFELFPDLPETWLRRKIDTVVTLRTRAFTSWEQRAWVFPFRNPRPITGTEPLMYQNLTISPLSGTDGQIQKVCLMVYDVTDVASTKLALQQANEKLAALGSR